MVEKLQFSLDNTQQSNVSILSTMSRALITLISLTPITRRSLVVFGCTFEMLSMYRITKIALENATEQGLLLGKVWITAMLAPTPVR